MPSLVVPCDTHEATAGMRALQQVTLRRRKDSRAGWSDIHVVFTNEAAIVTGDAYDWIFKWPGATNITSKIPRFNENYILGKLVATSTGAPCMVYDVEATVASLRDHYGNADSWPTIEAVARDAADEQSAIELLSEEAELEDAYDMVALRPSANLAVAVRAVQMAAKHLQGQPTGDQSPPVSAKPPVQVGA